MGVDDAGPSSSSGDKAVIPWNLTNVISLIISPAFALRITYFYGAVPLHYLESGWPLTTFGLTLSFCCLIRAGVFFPLYGQVGPGIMLPATVWHLCASVPMAIFPNNLAAVTLGIFGTFTCYFGDTWQGLNFSRFADPASRSQASRICTLADTLGFGMGPFVGGVLYDAGGWPACAIFQLAFTATELVLVWSNPAVRADLQRWWLARQSRRKDLANTPEMQDDPQQDCPLCFWRKRRTSSQKEIPAGILPREVRLPAFLIAFAFGLNISVYVIEVSVFAVYFRQEFNWRNAWWAGAAQMSGDYLAAMILVAVSKLKSRCRSDSRRDCYVLRLFRAPYHVSMLLLAWAVMHFLLASPVFAVAVAAQVLMGTLFVFNLQFLIEMMQMYGGKDMKLFLRLQCLSGTAFSIGIACASASSTWMYVTFGPRAPFYLGAVVSLAGFTVYSLGFFVRVGLPQSLQEFEEQHGLLPSSRKQEGQSDDQESKQGNSKDCDEERGAIPSSKKQEEQERESVVEVGGPREAESAAL